MPELVPRVRSMVDGQRIAALGRALVVTDVECIGPTLLVLVIVLGILLGLILRR